MTPAQREIIEEVASRHRLSMTELLGQSRRRPIAYARQEAMYLMRQTGRWSTPQIGRVFSRDHTTVIFAAVAHERRENAKLEADLAPWRGLGTRTSA